MRRFRSLVAGLPKDSATARALDPHGGHWPTDTELMAQVVDSLSILNVNFVRANSKKGTSVPNPSFVPRPDLPEEAVAAIASGTAPKRRMSSPDEMRAFFGGSVRYSPKPATPERSN